MTPRSGRLAVLCLSALLGLAHAHGALAQETQAYPRVLEGGENKDIDHGPGPAGNIVGGGSFRILDGGENAEAVAMGPVLAQPPLFAHVIGSGESARLVHSPFADRAAALAAVGEFPYADRPATALAAHAADDAG